MLDAKSLKARSSCLENARLNSSQLKVLFPSLIGSSFFDILSFSLFEGPTSCHVKTSARKSPQVINATDGHSIEVGSAHGVGEKGTQKRRKPINI